MKRLVILTVILGLCAAFAHGQAIPLMINYQGKALVNGVPADGPGQFKFALTNLAGDTYYWTNDGSTPTPPAAPTAAVTLNVSGGFYSANLGDTSLTNMTAIPVTVFSNPGVFLCVWFDDGGATGEQRLAPDRQLTSVPYAYMAERVAPLAISGKNLQRESVWPEHEGRSNTVVSYFGTGIANTYVTLGTVPSGKTYVITDVSFGLSNGNVVQSGGWIEVAYEKDALTTILGRWKIAISCMADTGGAVLQQPALLNFRAGLPVPEDAEIKVRNWQDAEPQDCVISGFEFHNE